MVRLSGRPEWWPGRLRWARQAPQETKRIGPDSTSVAVTIMQDYERRLLFAGFFVTAMPFAQMPLARAALFVMIRF